MSELSALARAVIFTVIGLIVLVVGSFAAFRMVGAGSVLGDVRVHGSEVGGLAQQDAEETIASIRAEITDTPLLFEVDGTVTQITGSQAGMSLDEDLVSRAMSVGRDGNIAGQFVWWLSSLFDDPTHLDLGATIDQQSIDQIATSWDHDLIGAPPFPGGIEIVEGTAMPLDPIPGTAVQREGLGDLIRATALGEVSQPVQVPTVPTVPGATPDDIEAAASIANQWIGNPIVLTAESAGVEVVFNPGDLANAFRSTVSMDGSIELSFDEASVESFLLNQQDQIEVAPVDARLEVDGYDVVIVPGRNGTLIDGTETVATLEALATSSLRRGPLPFSEGAEPEVTTEELEALGIEHMVVQFTTYHDCCQARVTNIQLMADTIDGAIIEPGETFGINAYVGERTAEKGYLDAGTIIRGEIVETVGGGVSQFATTLYNTVFWGGYEDVEHKPHSFYFSRYPEGIESTVSYPQPELTFRNDTDKAIMIKTAHTDTSITVRIFGDNDGRILAGAHRDGSTSFELIAEGGPDAKVVRGSVSERMNFTEPTTEYRPNPEVTPGEQIETQRPDVGWTVIVTRVIEHRGSETERTWTVRYLPQRQILEVHPCEVPGSSTPCPTTTTTTTVPPTTVPPETTTTTQP